MLLPGPEAQQLAIYIGWSLHGTFGGVVAGGLFVLPAALILWLLSWLYVSAGDVSWIKAIFYGLQPAVVAIVAIAILRIGRKALRNALTNDHSPSSKRPQQQKRLTRCCPTSRSKPSSII